MTSPRLVKSRFKAYIQQNGLCIYCKAPMWLDDPGSFAHLHRLKISKVRHLKCTAEHLKAKQDGGTDHADNIAAACYYCNSRRHRVKKALDPLNYKSWVAVKVCRGEWNPCLKHLVR